MLFNKTRLQNMIWTIVLFSALIGSAAYAQSHPSQLCEPWSDEWQETKVFFGLSKSGGTAISRRALDDFVQSEIVSAFPDGFTLVETTGFWRDRETNQTSYENGLMLVLLHPKTPQSDRRINQIAKAFRSKFVQQSVLVATSPSAVRGC